MLLATAVQGMLDARNALQQPEGVSMPVFISEQIQRLAQYTGAIEETLAGYESDLVKNEAGRFKEYMTGGKSANMASNLLKFDLTNERAEIVKLTRYANSSWKIIGVSQSRIKHLIEESRNQI